MTATPEKGVFIVRGLKTGLTRVVQLYSSDVLNANLTFDNGTGAAAGTPTYTTFPEPVLIEDYAIVTGQTVTNNLMVTVNNQPTGNILANSIHLTTLNPRPKMAILVPQGAQLSGVQLS